MARDIKRKTPGKLSAHELATIDILIAAAVRKGLKPSDGIHLADDVFDAVVDAVNDATDAAYAAATSAADAVQDAATSAADAVTDFADRINAVAAQQDQREMDNWQNMMSHVDNWLGGEIRSGDRVTVDTLSRAVKAVAAARITTLRQLIEVRTAAVAGRTKKTQAPAKPKRTR